MYCQLHCKQFGPLVLKCVFNCLCVCVCVVQNGWSPLLLAAEQGHTEVVKILLQNNARVDVFDEVRDD